MSLAVAALAALTAVGPIHGHQVAFAGDRVVWADRRELRELDPGGSARTVFRAPRRARIRFVAASGGRIAFLMSGYIDDALQWTSLRAGPPGGPFRRVTGHERPYTLLGPQSVAIADGGLVTVDRLKAGFRALWRPDGGAPVALERVEDNALVLAARGPFAALATDGAVTQYDLRTSAVVQSVALAGLAKVAVDADGSLAWLDATGRLTTPDRTLATGVLDLAGAGSGSVVFRTRIRARAVELASGTVRDLTGRLPSGAVVRSDGRLFAVVARGRLSVGAVGPYALPGAR